MGAIVLGAALPGCRTWHRHLMPAGLRLLMDRGSAVLGAVRTLHGRRSNTGHAKHAQGKHHKAGDLAQTYGDRRVHTTSHRGSIACLMLPRNREFWTSRIRGAPQLERQKVREKLRPPGGVLTLYSGIGLILGCE